MNIFKAKMLKIGNIKYKRDNGRIIVKNNSNKHGFLIIPRLYKYNGERRLVFEGEIFNGNAPTIKIINRHKTVMSAFDFNTQNIVSSDKIKYFILIIYVPENSEFTITNLCFDYETKLLRKKISEKLNNDTLVITPGYPSLSNKYNTAFVHFRVKEYLKKGIKTDVLCINSLPGISKYSFEGVEVIKGDYYFLREILSKKQYKRIIIHFFDECYGNILDSVDITHTNIYFIVHGAEVFYKILSEFASPYFGEPFNYNLSNKYDIKDYYIKKYNNLPNVKWIFVSDYVKKRLEEILNITINNYDIIPNYVDTEFFDFKKKTLEQRKKIFVLRKFTNDNCYALDIDVRAILELSRREIFSELEFDIYGSGEMFDIITNPVKNFSNVHLHPQFLNHEEVKNVHKTHGIGLFATRFDTQGLSLCEAASSGCVTVTSNIDVINGFIDKKLGVSCDVENYEEYATVIEKLVKDEKYYNLVQEKLANSIREKFNYENTVGREISLLLNDKPYDLSLKKMLKNPILTIIVPAYNVENYIWNGIASLVNQKNAHKLEILIIDDGSKDSTSKIGKTLAKIYPMVKLISKENGGHGSTINHGIEEATGKYVKVMDGDDTLNSYELEKLIDILEKENADIVLNNYIEDYACENKCNYKVIYPFMIPGKHYHFDDLCYEGYGFKEWGPILSCSSYKREFLKKCNFKLSEKCFYVDMELNTYISMNCQDIVYYPLDVYRYLLGRDGQSVSKASYMKNYKHHEKVIFNIINCFYENKSKLSLIRQEYILNKLIITMIKTQHIITTQFYKRPKPFREFNKKLKKYPEIYNNSKVNTRAIKFHRLTGGYLIFMNNFLVKVKRILVGMIK